MLLDWLSPALDVVKAEMSQWKATAQRMDVDNLLPGSNLLEGM